LASGPILGGINGITRGYVVAAFTSFIAICYKGTKRGSTSGGVLNTSRNGVAVVVWVITIVAAYRLTWYH
jgi:hypothetical protein